MTVAVLLTANTHAAITAQVGESVQIGLKDISSTGFRWEWRSDAPALTVLEAENVEPGSAPGAAGLRQFTFRTVARGAATLVFSLRRPWEGDQAPAEQREVTLTVK